jgi:hypothetical protein
MPAPSVNGRARSVVRRETLRYSAALTVVAFVVHYIWENLQCPLFAHRPEPTPMWLAMIRASLGDVALTWIAQLALARGTGQWIWPRRAPLRAWVLLLAPAGGMAVAIELYALQTSRWSYTVANPRVPGLGVSVLPLAQLMVLFPLSFLVAARLARRRARKGRSTQARAQTRTRETAWIAFSPSPKRAIAARCCSSSL